MRMKVTLYQQSRAPQSIRVDSPDCSAAAEPALECSTSVAFLEEGLLYCSHPHRPLQLYRNRRRLSHVQRDTMEAGLGLTALPGNVGHQCLEC